jgi:hypothetical protein
VINVLNKMIGTDVNAEPLIKEAEIGDNAQVVGILGPSFTVKGTEIIVMEKWSYEFVLLRSALVF